MGLVGFQAKPIDPNEKKKSNPNKGVKLNVKSNKTGAARKRDLADYTAYGDTLFEKAWRPAKEIVICFLPATPNHIRVSRDGKFAIEYISVGDQLQSTLFQFVKPIEYEYKHEELKIDEFETKLYGPFFDLEELKKRLMQIVKAEHLAIDAAEKAAALQKKQEEELAKEKAEADAEKLTEQLATAISGENTDSSQRETSTKVETQEKKEEIQIEAREEKTSDNENPDQDRELSEPISEQNEEQV